MSLCIATQHRNDHFKVFRALCVCGVGIRKVLPQMTFHDLQHQTIDSATHSGQLLQNDRAVLRIFQGALLTLAMIVLEIGAGYYYNSMALLADGWHMSSHALALGLSAAAYVAARLLSGYSRFAFGTWKIEVLVGYTSAILLMLVACFMVLQSVERLLLAISISHSI